jgi:hypothetical protein
MSTQDGGQTGLSSLRYQVPHLYYALGLTHFNRLPAAPGAFKDTQTTLMRKMVRQEVWDYWYDISRSGPHFDPTLTELRKPWADPVRKENIMYSGHVHAMAGMYGVLYNDDRYEKPDSIVFNYKPYSGIDAGQFSYDFTKLNDAIFWQANENGWLGVECEPNLVFLVCNQYPLLGFHFHDLRKGTSNARIAEDGFIQAWQKRGVLVDGTQANPSFMRLKQDDNIGIAPAGGAHNAAIMHAWAPELSKKVYAEAVRRSLKPGPNGTYSPFPNTAAVTAKVNAAYAAGQSVAGIEDRSFVWRQPAMGFAALWLAEAGETERLEGLLAHADTYMNPTWEKGGLYYPRNDRSWDADGNMTFMDTITGNADLAWARLSPAGGLNALYSKPFTPEHFARPKLAAVSNNVDVLRGTHVANGKGLALTLRGRDGKTAEAVLTVANAPKKAWALYRDKELVASGGSDGVASKETLKVEQAGGELKIQASVGKESDLLLVWA